MLQMKEIVGCDMNGSITAVTGSGMTSMSDALIGCQPRIDEPSKPRPSSKTLSSSSLIGVVKCCQVPRKSRNFRSTATAFCSLASLMASFGVLMLILLLFDLVTRRPAVATPRRRDVLVYRSERLLAALAGADANHLVDRQDEDLAVAD